MTKPGRVALDEQTIDVSKTMKAIAVASWAACGLILLSAFARSAVHYKPAVSASSTPPSIDGTYELTERVTANGTVLRPPQSQPCIPTRTDVSA